MCSSDLREGARQRARPEQVGPRCATRQGVHGEDDGGRGRYSAPWVHPPCVAEQLDGVMDLGEAFSQALHLVTLTTAAREAAFGAGDD